MNHPTAPTAPSTPLPPARVLVVEDDPLVRVAVRLALEAAGHTVIDAPSAHAARQATRDRPADLVVLDSLLPDADPGALLAEFVAAAPDSPVLIITGHPTVECAIGAFRDGAWDYLLKPFDAATLCRVVAEALHTTRLRRQLAQVRRAAAVARHDSPVITASAAMRAILDLAERVAAHPTATVLLEGESGTGKGLLARCIHDWSDRRAAPFVTITCSAIPEQLLEAELFGHERGAFTGATSARAGLAASAEGGTLFLDEIGEMGANLQSKLLYLIETHRYRPVGASDERQADVRIVTATNRDLLAAMRDGLMREDLYYRLRVVPIRLPALRDRPGDIPLIVQQLIERLAGELGRAPPAVATPAMDALARYGWPGNVRELRNVIERALVVSTGPRVEVEDLPPEVRGGVPVAQGGARWRFLLPPEGTDLQAAERDFVIQALRRAGGNRTEAARLLGLNRDGVRYRVKKFGLDVAVGREPQGPEAGDVGGPSSAPRTDR